MSEIENNVALLELTAQIVSSHVANNPMSGEELPGMIKQVYNALQGAGQAEPEPERPQPAVPIKRSVFPDYIVCLEDGKKLKMLKRHLQSAYGMTPEQYRERWGLPADYPLVAPNYAERRSHLAREIGLGRKINAGLDAATRASAEEGAESEDRPSRRGRAKKV
ncbi:MucR family transcriptional regulator [Swaminathania salitolerans]|uniref:MucR family transcriptional regulator n=1 Tax=Swaminathania salitolerans TaxID=182838 RepID=A0A511BPH3_9PROT|nr:MucR family transcriptional regulator [Swaminathania salitolerans]GBQ10894.1 Ros/MucR family transcriptional regulator [Swaminathania salitolerans LMG 21291]GEL02220.1 MucR family transcriptional regulator [Swaminathania salitolerans]